MTLTAGQASAEVAVRPEVRGQLLLGGSVHAAKAAALCSADDARAEGFTVVDPSQVVGRLRVAHGAPHAVASDIKARVATAVAARSIPLQPSVLGLVHQALFNYHRTGRLSGNQAAWAPAVFHLHLAAGSVRSAQMVPSNAYLVACRRWVPRGHGRAGAALRRHAV